MKKCKYPKLDGKITEVFGSRKTFAASMGLSENSVSAKMRGRFPWKPAEILKACEMLGIDKADVATYFFE